MDTKGLPTNGVHYKAQGHVVIGQLCAQRWLGLHFQYGSSIPTPVIHPYSHASAMQPPPASLDLSFLPLFDLSGRKVGRALTGGNCAMNRTLSPHCILIAPHRSGKELFSGKMIVIGK
jgi:hypothetical protein